MWAGFALLSTFGVTIGCSGCGPSGNGTNTADCKPSFGSNNGTGDNVIKLGLVSSLSGNLKPWGLDSEAGAQLAVDEVNAAGGVNGKKVQLMIEDSASKPEQGKSAAQKLISEGAVCILGEVSSGISGAMKVATQAQGIPQIAVGATKTDLTAGTDDLVRVCYTDKLQGPVMAKFAFDQLRLHNMAIITDKTQPYSQGLSASFKAYFIKLGGTIVDEETYETGATQFGGILTNLKAKSPDGVFCSGYFPEVGPLVQQARQAGLDKNKVPFLGGDGWDSSDILTSGGDAIVGSYFCNHYNNQDKSPAVQDFLKRWAAAACGSLPGTTMGALGYDAAKLAMDAMKRAKTLSPADIRDALNNTVDFPGVSGTITLKGWHGNPPKRALVVQLTSDKSKPQDFVKAYDYFDIFPEEKNAPGTPTAATATQTETPGTKAAPKKP